MRVILDTNIILGVLWANNQLCMDLADHIEQDNCNLIILMCNGVFGEVKKNMGYQMQEQMIQYHFVTRFKKRDKLVRGYDGEDCSCIASDDDDQHLVNCASSNNCSMIISRDTRLHLSGECNCTIVAIDDFISSHKCSN